MRQVPTIFLLGPQGSGKGVQAERLAKKYHLAIIEAGALLRSLAKQRQQTNATRAILRSMKQGKLVPTTIMFHVLKKAVLKLPSGRGVIFDGATRKPKETTLLMNLLEKKLRRNVTHTIFLDVSRRESVRRLMLRKRFDDTPAAIRKRLALYHKTTRPVLAYLRKKTPFFRINGEQSVTAVFQDVDTAYRKGLEE